MVREEQADEGRVEDDLPRLMGEPEVFVPVAPVAHSEDGEAAKADVEDDHGVALLRKSGIELSSPFP